MNEVWGDLLRPPHKLLMPASAEMITSQLINGMIRLSDSNVVYGQEIKVYI